MTKEEHEKKDQSERLGFARILADDLLFTLKRLQSEIGRSEGARVLAIAITDLEKATWGLEKAEGLL